MQISSCLEPHPPGPQSGTYALLQRSAPPPLPAAPRRLKAALRTFLTAEGTLMASGGGQLPEIRPSSGVIALAPQLLWFLISLHVRLNWG